MPNNLRALRATAAAVCAALSLALLLAPAPAWAAGPGSPNIVISQVYGGGGNSGATYRYDFIELFNRGSAAVDLTGWSVQYASTTGSSWQKTTLSGSIEPGRYYLVQEAKGSGGTVDLPTPSAIGTILMAAGAGKVALVNNSTTLSGSCPGGVVDFVGFGTGTNCSETAPTATLSNITAALRKGDGSVDTDDNSADFIVAAPFPRSAFGMVASGAATPSSAAEGETVLLTVRVNPASNPASTGITVAADLSNIGGPTAQPLLDDGSNGDLTAGDNTFSFQATIAAGTTIGAKSLNANVSDAQSRIAVASIPLTVTPIPVPAAIHAIQGTGDLSPLADVFVETTGIVTARKSGGFFMQTTEVDSDPNTSEGIYVYTGSTPPETAALGNLVAVRGTVSDYIPSADPFSPALTELSGSLRVLALSSGNPLPDPVTITAADVLPGGGVLQLEKYEGMRVHVDSLTVTGPTDGSVNESTATSTSNGLFFGVFPGVPRPFREPGIEMPEVAPPGVPIFDANPERLRVDTGGQTGATPINVTSGAVVTNLTGVLDYGYRAYSIATDPGTAPGFSGNISLQPAPVPGEHEVTIASANLERFFDTSNDPSTSDAVLTASAFGNRLNKVSLAVRNVLRLPDMLGVEEVENLATLQALAAKINSDAAADGLDPQYQAYLAEGNDIGGIDVGFLVKGSRIEVLDITQEGKDATYIDPTTGDPAMLNDRPPLVLRATVRATGKEIALPLTVIVNHLRSLSGVNDPVDGRVRAKRRAQAEFLANLIQQYQTGDSPENVISVGDYNAYDVNDGYVDVMGIIMGTLAAPEQDVLPPTDLTPLVSPSLLDLSTTVTADQRYSYVYDGNAQMLDHVLANGAAMRYFSRFAFARNNADFPEAFRSDPNRPERYSDHDVPIAYFNVPFYKFGGFLGLKTSGVKPGSTIPLKFQIQDAEGNLITAASVVSSIQVAYNTDCQGGADGAPSSATAAGGSRLRFDATAGQFVFNWQTATTMTGCYNILLGLDDGATYSAIIHFN